MEKTYNLEELGRGAGGEDHDWEEVEEKLDEEESAGGGAYWWVSIPTVLVLGVVILCSLYVWRQVKEWRKPVAKVKF